MKLYQVKSTVDTARCQQEQTHTFSMISFLLFCPDINF